MNEAIQASNLAKSFGLTRALDGLDLSVKKSGEVHGFLGPNGAARRRSCASCSGCCGPTRARRGCWPGKSYVGPECATPIWRLVHLARWALSLRPLC
jgi:hypothetical protein